MKRPRHSPQKGRFAFMNRFQMLPQFKSARFHMTAGAVNRMYALRGQAPNFPCWWDR